MNEFAYSTDNPEAVTAYRQAVAARNAYGKGVHDDLKAMGAGPQVYLRSSGFSGPDEVTGIEQNGDHVPEGWQVVRGRLEPRRGKPGEQARRWLAEHQPPDVRHILEKHGLPRASWMPGGGLNWRIVQPHLFEHEGTLWACYQAEPGTSESGFDSERCTWTRRKLSEFHAAREAMEAATETDRAVANA